MLPRYKKIARGRELRTAIWRFLGGLLEMPRDQVDAMIALGYIHFDEDMGCYMPTHKMLQTDANAMLAELEIYLTKNQEC
jgi:hypothetical protein